jgi:hypothetical protein
MPRYIVASCCANPRHAPNHADRYFQDDMSTQLDTFKRNLKDHIHSLQKKNIKVEDPNLDIRGMDPTDIWGRGSNPSMRRGSLKNCKWYPPDGLQI